MADIPDYDAGFLNDWGDGNVEWWHDYLRAEIGRANDHWRESCADLIPRADAELAVAEAIKKSESVFMEAVWSALKTDANDLRKQQRILKAFRALAPAEERNAAEDQEKELANELREVRAERDAALARVEKLREALTTIADGPPFSEVPSAWMARCIHNARAALDEDARNA